MAGIPRNLNDFMSLASRALGGEGSAHLPLCDPETVIALQDAYEEAFQSGKETDEARFRLVWALVHSPDLKHVNRGLELAQRHLELQGRSPLAKHANDKEQDRRDILYLAAVARYRLGQYLLAREDLKQLLQTYPEFRQAESLKSLCDEKLLRDGLVAGGIGAAVVGVGLALLFGSRK